MYDLVYFDHPSLTTTSKEVEFGEDVADLIERMFMIVQEHDALGLAANQVGIATRVIVCNVRGQRFELINPEIIKANFGRSKLKEGCLSFPEIIAKKVRWNRIVVRGFDKNWNKREFRLKGLAARCVQHEIDHLNGINIA